MTPGNYLRLRREAAGLTMDDVVMLITPDERRWPLALVLTFAIELDEVVPSSSELEALRFAFPFDRYIFRQLVGRLDPKPEICGTCGCSALDACDDERAGPCAWATPAHDLCTACAASGASHQENDHAICRCPA